MRARSEVGLSRLPVTEEIAGSNPVGPATKTVHQSVDFFRGENHPENRGIFVDLYPLA